MQDFDQQAGQGRVLLFPRQGGQKAAEYRPVDVTSPAITEYVVVCDLAKDQDAAIIQIYHITPELVPGVKELNRPDRVIRYADLVYCRKTTKESYTHFVASLCTLCSDPKILGKYTLLTDVTGVGAAVVEMMQQQGLAPIPISFSSGSGWRPVYSVASGFGGGGSSRAFGSRLAQLDKIVVSKEEMTSAAIIIMQQQRLRISRSLPQILQDDIRKQLLKFTGKVNERTKKVAYENLTDQDHDDQVVCILMLAFWLVRYVPSMGEVNDHAVERDNAIPWGIGEEGVMERGRTVKAGWSDPHAFV
ncbi:MAG: hypothetical protein WCS71_03720 [Sphaerochaetaceae bacterium]